MDLQDNIEKAKQIIKNADALFITAGAGIGVDSGLPDFRGNEGFWKAYPPIAQKGISFSEMANPYWFKEDPQLAWAFYGHRLNLYRSTIPHDGFEKLFKVANNYDGGYFVFTSNVDGQFQKAGFNDNLIEECHGSIHHFQCVEPCCNDIWDASNIDLIIDEELFEAQLPLPQCPKCGGLARPNILMFGDWYWLSHRSNEQANRLDKWFRYQQKSNHKVAIIEMGAGHAVPTVRFKSQHVLRYLDADLIRINPRDYDVPEGQIGIPTGAKEGIEVIIN